MATLGMQITPAGPVAPSYPDILQQLKNMYWSIYGADANLDADTQDGQLIAGFAQAINDTNQAALAAYNSFSPATAQGAGLSSVVKINSIRRKSASASTAVVTITGVAGTTIIAGIVGDGIGLGTQWLLPDLVTIDDSGQIEATATCAAAGAITMAPGQLTKILSPTLGWQTVTNAEAAVPGNPIETDADLRRRQSKSVSLAAETVLGALVAAIANLAGVGRSTVYENDTDEDDTDGLPPHSIAAVVEGGSVDDILNAIAAKKAPGVQAFGSVTQTIVDPNGIPITVGYFPLATVPITIDITIKRLPGYIVSTGEQIVAALADFVSSLEIGEDSYLARLYSPANLGGIGAGATFVVTQILQARDINVPAAGDIALAFNEAAFSTADRISLHVTA